MSEWKRAVASFNESSKMRACCCCWPPSFSDLNSQRGKKESQEFSSWSKNDGCKNSKKSQKSGDVTIRLHLQFIEVASKALNPVLACCARGKSDFCPFDSVRNWRWLRRAENVSTDGFIIASGAMAALFPSDAIVLTGKYYRPSFLYK